ncbi:cation:proton antiporter [Streptomyces sp. NPDC008125]|uniref:cation:proton antiporter domain-containing protein n=1 Tax=Streptomyces sp. NPDC008125 TaxID=3364811 RepID=UPI0036EA37F9
MTETQAAVLLADIALIIAVARFAGLIARRLGQPAVIGEIAVGVLLGPTLLNGTVAATLFPADIRPYLGAVANLGLVLFMFLIGLEFDFARLRGSGRVTGAAVLGSTLVPFALGILLGWYLLRSYDPGHRVAFVLFIGVAVSVTAFPVLARILADRGMNGTWLGAVALSAAAFCDLAAWTTLAGLQALAGAGGTRWWLVLLSVPYVLVLFLVVRPLLARFLARRGSEETLSAGDVTVVVAAALASAALTQLLGLHFVIGAFLFGLAMPRMHPARHEGLLRRTEHTTTLLLPVYFIVAGLKVDLSGLGADGLVQLGWIMVVAVTGKFAGTWLGARSQGVPARSSAVLAGLMNTRGLTELIALGVGLEAGLIDERLYSLFVVMAVATTAMTGPLLGRLMGRDDGSPPLLDPDLAVPPRERAVAGTGR